MTCEPISLWWLRRLGKWQATESAAAKQCVSRGSIHVPAATFFYSLGEFPSRQSYLFSSSSNNDNGIKSTAEMGSGVEVSGDGGTDTIVGYGTTHGAAEE